MPQFDLNLISPLVFWSIVSFGILLFILSKYALPPVLDILDERSNKIQGEIERGETLKAELEAMKAGYEEKMAVAEEQANSKLQEAIKEAQSFKEEIIQEAKKQGDEILRKAEKDIEYERKKVMAEIHDQVVSLSIVTASKILRHSVDESAAKRIADDIIRELGDLS